MRSRQGVRMVTFDERRRGQWHHVGSHLPGIKSRMSRSHSMQVLHAGSSSQPGKNLVTVELPKGMGTGWDLRMLRNNIRLVSALVLLAFVVCHLTASRPLLCFFS